MLAATLNPTRQPPLQERRLSRYPLGKSPQAEAIKAT
jgi:hypothetical protein